MLNIQASNDLRCLAMNFQFDAPRRSFLYNGQGRLWAVSQQSHSYTHFMFAQDFAEWFVTTKQAQTSINA
jgi:hypothetical protein